MSKKTSTAALESFCERQLPNRRRVPRHPARGRGSNEVKKQRGRDGAREFGQALIAVGGNAAMNRNTGSRAAGKFRVILPVILRITFSLVLWTLGVTTITITEAICDPLTSTRQKENNPQLTRRAALTTPPGGFSRLKNQ
jgi:hypothetical protein